MKCMKKDGQFKRVSDQIAALLAKQGWVYCPRWEWKAAGKPK